MFDNEPLVILTRKICIKSLIFSSFILNFIKRGGGGGPTTKKIMPPGKTQDVLCLFCSFSKHVQNRRFCAQFGQKVKMCPQKRTKKIMIFVFFDLF